MKPLTFGLRSLDCDV